MKDWIAAFSYGLSKGDSAHCFVMYKVGNHRLQLLTQIIRLVLMSNAPKLKRL